MSSSSDALASIEAIVEHGGDADDILRAVVATLHEQAGYPWAAIFFVEDGVLAIGPHAGTAALTDENRTTVPVVWQASRVAELAVDDAPEENRRFLERVADLVSTHCLVGWDTGGESWEP
jgi:putative methionine-R-sulfoxide reductase with GAF domain